MNLIDTDAVIVAKHTRNLRWAVPDHTTTKTPRLQQAVECRRGNEFWIEWEDVPTVVVPAQTVTGNP